MTRLRKIKASLFFLFSLVLASGSAQAVCIDGNPTIAEEFASSKAVFTALVEKRIRVVDTENDFVEAHVFILKLKNLYKGSFPPMVVSYSENSSGRFDMDTGETYLIFSNYGDNPITIDNCGNSDSKQNSHETLQKVMELSKNDA